MDDMKQQLSALMDGEMDMQANPHWLESVVYQKEMAATWRTYHLIGDALRGDVNGCNITAAVSENLKSEPVVLAPKPVSRNQWRSLKLSSLAASIAAVGFVGWVAWQAQGLSGSHGAAPHMAQNNAPIEQAALSDKLDDYMLAHHEYASTNPMSYGVEVKNASLTESAN